MASTPHHSTLDITEPGREVELASEAFVRGDREEIPHLAIASLRMAVELALIVVPGCSRHQAEQAAVAEFLTRVGLKLCDANDADEVFRRARHNLDELFSD